MKNAAQRILANKGRYGDTELVHVNKGEKDLLKRLGGAGTINPLTGLREFYEYDGSSFDGYDANNPESNFGGWGNGTAEVVGPEGESYGTSGNFNSDSYGQSDFNSTWDATDRAGQAPQDVQSALFDPTPMSQQQQALVGVSAPTDMLSAQAALAQAAPSMGMSQVAGAAAPMGNAMSRSQAPQEAPSRGLFDALTDKAATMRDQFVGNLRDEILSPDPAKVSTPTIDWNAIGKPVEQAVAASVPGFMGAAPPDQVALDEARAKDIRMGYAVPDAPAVAAAPTPTARPADLEVASLYPGHPAPQERPADLGTYATAAPALSAPSGRGPSVASAPATASPGPVDHRNVDPLTRQTYDDRQKSLGSNLIGNSADDTLAPPEDKRPWSEKVGQMLGFDPSHRNIDPLTRQAYDDETGNKYAFDPATMSKGWGIGGGLLGTAIGGPLGGIVGGLAGQGFGALMANARPGAPDFAAQTYGGAGEGGNEGAARAAQAALMANAGGAAPASVGAAAAAANPFRNAINDPLRNKWYTTPNRG